jgi:RNA polymerase sigma-70 factor (ECF subfamily)
MSAATLTAGFHPRILEPVRAAVILRSVKTSPSQRPVERSAVDAKPAADDEAVRLDELVAAVAQQDEAALGQLYDATLPRVYGVSVRITRDAKLAEDVCEEVYWQVWREALRFDPARGRALTWILTIARSRALDSLRRKEDADPHPDPASLGGPDGSMEANPQDLLEAMQRNHALHAALAALDAIPRQLLSLAYFRGLTHEEIAAQTGMPLGTVKSHLRRSLDTMRSLLAGIDKENQS